MVNAARNVRIFVEGGGDSAALKGACRHGFSSLVASVLETAGLKHRMPAIVACGGRSRTFERFCAALADAGPTDIMVLLVDAEGPVAPGSSPWAHLKARPGDGWDVPHGANDDHCHLMTQCMEAWLVSDAPAFAKFFGKGFHAPSMPQRTGAALEQEPKDDLYGKIEKATAKCDPKAPYGKGAHSFKLLARVDPKEVRKLPWADRFFKHLESVV